MQGQSLQCCSSGEGFWYTSGRPWCSNMLWSLKRSFSPGTERCPGHTESVKKAEEGKTNKQTKSRGGVYIQKRNIMKVKV